MIDGKGVARAPLGVKSAQALEKKEVRSRHGASRNLRSGAMAVHVRSPGTHISAPNGQYIVYQKVKISQA